MKYFIAIGLGTFCLITAQGALYNGNGNTSAAGAVGLGSLNLTDNGTTISATFTKGGSSGVSFSSVLVLFIDSTVNGFTDTTQFSDAGSGLRQAVSGINTSGSARSTAVFASGFAADYAIALGVDQGAAVFRLVGGGNGSLELMRDLTNFGPRDSQNHPSYTFSFDWADIGLSPGSGNSIKFESTYITATGFRNLESFESLTGLAGFDNTVTFGNYDTYPIAPVPELTNSSLAIFGALALGMGFFGRARAFIKRLSLRRRREV